MDWGWRDTNELQLTLLYGAICENVCSHCAQVTQTKQDSRVLKITSIQPGSSNYRPSEHKQSKKGGAVTDDHGVVRFAVFSFVFKLIILEVLLRNVSRDTAFPRVKLKSDERIEIPRAHSRNSTAKLEGEFGKSPLNFKSSGRRILVFRPEGCSRLCEISEMYSVCERIIRSVRKW